MTESDSKSKKDESASWNFTVVEDITAPKKSEATKPITPSFTQKAKKEAELKLELQPVTQRKSRRAVADDMDHDEVYRERKVRTQKREKKKSTLALFRKLLIIAGYLIFIALIAYILNALGFIN